MVEGHYGAHFVMVFPANEALQLPHMEQYDLVFILSCNQEGCLYLGTSHKFTMMLTIWKKNMYITPLTTHCGYMKHISQAFKQQPAQHLENRWA